MLRARVLLGLSVFSAVAAADDLTFTNEFDLQLSQAPATRLTLFDGAVSLTPVKPNSGLRPVTKLSTLATQPASRPSKIQRLSFTTEECLNASPIPLPSALPVPDAPVLNQLTESESCVSNGEWDSPSEEAELRTRVEAQDRQLADLQAQMGMMAAVPQRVQYRGDSASSCSAGCGESCQFAPARRYDGCHCYPRLTAAAEVPFLRSRLSGALPVFNVGASAERMIDSAFEPSIRYHLEYQQSASFALRARHFRYDRSLAFEPPYRPAQMGIELTQTDVEAVFRHSVNQLQFDVSGGFEHARLEYGADLPTAVGVGTASFEGVGPVFALNAAHNIGRTSLSCFCGVRASMLMGKINNSTLLVNMPQSKIQDETMQVYSNQIGVEWSPLLSNNIGVSVRAAWETQYWVNSTFSDDALGIGSNLNLTGPTVAAQIEY